MWKGQSNFLLEGFIAQHQNAYVSVQQYAEHIEYQLPNKHTRVSYLLNRIQSADAGIQRVMASVRTDDGPTGMCNNFEATAAHILPYDPVAKKRLAVTKWPVAQASTIHGEEVDISAVSGMTKPSIGKTGVHLQYHTHSEYCDLTME